jgi:hypothetical protein
MTCPLPVTPTGEAVGGEGEGSQRRRGDSQLTLGATHFRREEREEGRRASRLSTTFTLSMYTEDVSLCFI